MLFRSDARQQNISKIVLERILVLAVAQEVNRDETKPKVVNAVTLEVTPEQAERLDLARSVGTLSLTGVETGAVVEYSIDGGSTWVDIGSLTAVNGYSGTIDTHNYSDSPLKGRSGFVAASNGARTTRIDLSSLAGTSARFRFLVATDSGGSGTGWYLDDVRIYSCRGADTPAKPSTKPPTPVSKPPATKKPPAGGTWTVDRAKDRIVVKLPVIQSWSYRIRGVSGSRSAKGTCKRSGSIVICTLKARTARWRVTITAFNNRTSYAVTSRRVRT